MCLKFDQEWEGDDTKLFSFTLGTGCSKVNGLPWPLRFICYDGIHGYTFHHIYENWPYELLQPWHLAHPSPWRWYLETVGLSKPCVNHFKPLSHATFLSSVGVLLDEFTLNTNKDIRFSTNLMSGKGKNWGGRGGETRN